jgi:hypothetical protein
LTRDRSWQGGWHGVSVTQRKVCGVAASAMWGGVSVLRRQLLEVLQQRLLEVLRRWWLLEVLRRWWLLEVLQRRWLLEVLGRRRSLEVLGRRSLEVLGRRSLEVLGRRRLLEVLGRWRLLEVLEWRVLEGWVPEGRVLEPWVQRRQVLERWVVRRSVGLHIIRYVHAWSCEVMLTWATSQSRSACRQGRLERRRRRHRYITRHALILSTLYITMSARSHEEVRGEYCPL